MRANITISNWKSPDRGERKYHMYAGVSISQRRNSTKTTTTMPSVVCQFSHKF